MPNMPASVRKALGLVRAGEWELRALFVAVSLVFAAFFVIPLVFAVGKSFMSADGALTI
ncbi:MAG: hypothetical protein ACLUCU_06820 [Slackia sp.]